MPKVMMDENIKPSIIHNENPYYFLIDTEDFLLTEFTDETFTEKVNRIHLCIYMIDDSCYYLPFLKYLLQYIPSNNHYTFPNFEYEHTMDNEHDKCKNACLNEVYKMFNFKPSANMNEEHIINSIQFIGHIKNKDNEIYAIIHINNKEFNQKFTKIDNIYSYNWSVLHEIVNSQMIYNIQVHSLLQNFFLDYPELLYIKNKDNIPIDIPYLLYPLISNKDNIQSEQSKQPPEQPSEEPLEQPPEQPSEEQFEQPPEQSSEQPSEEPLEQPPEQPSEEPPEEQFEQPSEEPPEEQFKQPSEEQSEQRQRLQEIQNENLEIQNEKLKLQSEKLKLQSEKLEIQEQKIQNDKLKQQIQNEKLEIQEQQFQNEKLKQEPKIQNENQTSEIEPQPQLQVDNQNENQNSEIEPQPQLQVENQNENQTSEIESQPQLQVENQNENQNENQTSEIEPQPQLQVENQNENQNSEVEQENQKSEIEQDNQNSEIEQDNQNSEIEQDNQNSEIEQENQTSEIEQDNQTSEIEQDNQNSEIEQDNQTSEIEQDNQNSEVKQELNPEIQNEMQESEKQKQLAAIQQQVETKQVNIMPDKGGNKKTIFQNIYDMFTIKGGGNIIYANLTLSDEEFVLLPEKINDPVYGFFYYFSNDIINTENIQEIPKYVVFIEKCSYIVNKEIETDTENVSSIYFQNENSLPIWCLKTSDFFTRIQ